VQADRSLRIVLAEDSVLLREGLAGLLRRFGHTVVARVGDAPALVAAVQEHDPDIVVTDVRMPPGFSDEGLRAAVTLRAAHPALPVLVLSQYVEQTYAAELLDTDPRHGRGAGVGYLLKDRVGELLGRRRDPIDRLTPREREVLALMAEGWSNAAIARTLVVTEAAVAKHIGSILTKLDLPPAEDDHRRVRAVLAYLRA
jgi:DNA-binding NarL/FixJ family response regulator